MPGSNVPNNQGNRYYWVPSQGLNFDTCANLVASPSKTTWYYVTITDSAGCQKTDSILITVENPCPQIFVPNAFSPSSNTSANQSECVYGGCIQSLYFAIFDRWGNKVFETTDQSKCWDGNFNGVPMNTGEFVYFLKVTLTNGQTTEQKGNITLIR